MRLFIFLDEVDTVNPKVCLHVNGNTMFMTPGEATKLMDELRWATESVSAVQKRYFAHLGGKYAAN